MVNERTYGRDRLRWFGPCPPPKPAADGIPQLARGTEHGAHLTILGTASRLFPTTKIPCSHPLGARLQLYPVRTWAYGYLAFLGSYLGSQATCSLLRNRLHHFSSLCVIVPTLGYVKVRGQAPSPFIETVHFSRLLHLHHRDTLPNDSKPLLGSTLVTL